MRTIGWTALLAATGGAFVLGAMLARRQDHAGGVPAPRGSTVRDAGTKEMRDPPRDWDQVDEFVDESFPASDPPSTY